MLGLWILIYSRICLSARYLTYLPVVETALRRSRSTAVHNNSRRRGEQAASAQYRQGLSQEFSNSVPALQRRLLDRLHAADGRWWCLGYLEDSGRVVVCPPPSGLHIVYTTNTVDQLQRAGRVAPSTEIAGHRIFSTRKYGRNIGVQHGIGKCYRGGECSK